MNTTITHIKKLENKVEHKQEIISHYSEKIKEILEINKDKNIKIVELESKLISKAESARMYKTMTGYLTALTIVLVIFAITPIR